jgi:hypothetical protein
LSNDDPINTLELDVFLVLRQRWPTRTASNWGMTNSCVWLLEKRGLLDPAFNFISDHLQIRNTNLMLLGAHRHSPFLTVIPTLFQKLMNPLTFQVSMRC